MQDVFLGGVVEGFYGQPWTHSQRLDLFEKMAKWGLNAYFYAPKDDLKHRAQWRVPYDDVEISRMAELVSACGQRDIHFLYGLSPGLDIRFSDSDELQAIQNRLQQMRRIGVQHFALLFDDLPGKMTEQDKATFSSIASAQASVTNAVYNWLRSQSGDSRLLFCPTPYCDRMVSWQLGGANYLETIGSELDERIDVLWTGPEIISRDIPVDSLDRLAAKIRRQPIIWDNLHANDYDHRRLYCGPYRRSSEMRAAVRGVFSNPNNEYPINFVPLQTLGDYLNQSDYRPRNAYLNAVADWCPQYATMEGEMTVADVELLADCFYLPYENGDRAGRLKRVSLQLLETEPADWDDAFDEFLDFHACICRVFDQLTKLKNRNLFYAWSRRIWELKEELDLIKDYAECKKQGKEFRSETHLPFTCRGGIVADLQRKLAMRDDGRFEAK